MTTELRTLWLKLTLLSDTTFGRGDGLAGSIDAEIQHDEYGLPFLKGKTLKGILASECAEILFALEQCSCQGLDNWRRAAALLFGSAGGHLLGKAGMHVGDARLPDGLRAAVMEDFPRVDSAKERQLREKEWGLKRAANLDSLTALRRQTAMDQETGAPRDNTLRTMRVILRKTPFVSRLDFLSAPSPQCLWLLAACTRAFRRAGTGRSRGRGLLLAELYDTPIYGARSGEKIVPQPVTPTWFDSFAMEVRRECPDVSHTAD